MPLFLIIALLLGGSATVASEGALPGDVLYPVKVNVNESIRGAVAVGAEADGEWHMEQAKRRLDEAIELANKNELTVSARAEVEQRFVESAARVEARIKELQETDPGAAAELAGKFEASLQAYTRLLGNLKTSSNGMNEMATVVRGEQGMASSLRLKNENALALKSDTEVSAKESVVTAGNAIAEARASLEKTRAKRGVKATADAEARLSVAEENLASAQAHITAQTYGEAVARAGEAERDAHEALTLLGATVTIGAQTETSASVADSKGALETKGSINIKLGE